MAAGRIKGITIQLDADATPLQKALSGVDKSLRQTQSNLRDVNKLLKLDPGNTTLLTQKQKALKDAIGLTKDRLQQLKDAQKGVKEGTAEWDGLQREIIDTEQKLDKLKAQYRDFGSVAKQQLQAVGEKLKETGQKVTDFGEKLAPVSGAAAALGGAMVKLGYDTVKNADELSTLSKQTGISTDSLQKMQYASELVDVSVEDITGALKKMKPKMTDSNKTFEKLGVSIKKSDGSMRDAETVFYDAIGALSKIENETERDQVAMELFGKSADSLAGIIDDGGAAMKAFGQEAEDMGLILDEETIGSLADTDDTIQKLKGQLAGTMAQIGANVASVLGPALEKAAELIGKITERLRQLTPEQTETILKIVGIVAAVAPVIIIIGKVISGIGAITSAIGFLMSPMGLIVVAIAAVIAIGVALYKNWDKVCEWADKVKQEVIKAWNDLKTNVSHAVNTLKTAVTNAWNAIKTGVTNAVNNIRTGVVTVWTGIKTTISNVVTGIRTTVSNVFEALKSNVVNTFNGIKTVATSVWEGIKFAITHPIEAAKNAVRNAINAIKGFLSGTLKFPHIKIPHFHISGGEMPWGIGGKGTPPSISVDWYKKAYENPYLFTTPTIVAGKGFGDGGGSGEIVYGRDQLLSDIAIASGRDQLASDIYKAMTAALDNMDTTIVISGREFGRILREQGAIA